MDCTRIDGDTVELHEAESGLTVRVSLASRVADDGALALLQVDGMNADLEGECPGTYYLRPIRERIVSVLADAETSREPVEIWGLDSEGLRTVDVVTAGEVAALNDVTVWIADARRGETVFMNLDQIADVGRIAEDGEPADRSDDCLLIEWDGGWDTADDLDAAHRLAANRGLGTEYDVTVNEVDGALIWRDGQTVDS